VRLKRLKSNTVRNFKLNTRYAFPAIILAALLIFILVYVKPVIQPTSPHPSNQAVIDKALCNLEKAETFRIKINEEIKTQTLTFQGVFRKCYYTGRDELKGSFKENNIEVWMTGSELHVRAGSNNYDDVVNEINENNMQEIKKGTEIKSKNEAETPTGVEENGVEENKEWKSAEKLQLESLKSFLMQPLQLIIQSRSNGAPIKKGPELSDNNTLLYTYFWEIKEPSFYKNTFPGLDQARLKNGITSVYLNPESLKIKKVRVSLHFNEPAEQYLQRTIEIEYPQPSQNN